MANRESYPSQLFPLRGDVSAEAGDTSVTVVGIQTTPVDPTAPTQGQSLIAVNGVWTPESVGAAIMVEGIPVSDDYEIGVEISPVGTTGSPAVLVEGV
jgi:hypothetical protein